MRLLPVLSAVLFFGIPVFSQSPSFFQDVQESQISQNSPRRIVPASYRTVRVDFEKLKIWLAAAPSESKIISGESDGLEFSVPLADGREETFQVWDAPVMHPDLAAKFPGIRSFSGRSLAADGTTIRFDFGPNGFHAMILSPVHGSVFIDPYAHGNLQECLVYERAAFYETCLKTMDCELLYPQKSKIGAEVADRAGDCGLLHKYRLALACTGEYAVFHGGTTALALAAMNTSMTRINGVYEKELSVRMEMVANNNLIVYLNGATDPYSNNNGSAMLGQNQTTCDGVIGAANYDVGHVFSTGGGGVAYLGVPCEAGYKAGGVTGSSSPIGDPFDIDYVAHEMGHQFGAEHTFYSNVGSCNGNMNNSTAMEPGSGSTIMAYAGICGSNNVQSNSDAYFHTVSLLEIGAYVLTNTCDVEMTNGNSAPAITSLSNATIPTSTPYRLTTPASDPDSDPITWNWEQYNPQTGTGLATMPPLPANTKGPLSRSWTATTSSERYFPKLADVIANNTPTWERLASVNRTLYYRLTVRDNNPLGGCTTQFPAASTGIPASATTAISLTTSTTGAPFTVNYPTGTGISWPRNSSQTVTWTPVGTATTVDILMSTDGGVNFSTILASGTANDGTQAIMVPLSAPLVSTARVMIRAVGNYYYDVSNNNFTITEALPLELLSFDARLVSEKTARLDWTTGSELDIRGFRVERSIGSAFHFEPIGFVESAGDSELRRSYAFTDEKMEPGQTHYYRLAFEEKSGIADHFSPVRAISTGQNSQSILFEPNPVSEKATLKFGVETGFDGPVELEFFNSAGVFLEKRLLENDFEMDLSALPAGMFVVVARSERQVWTGRFFKF